jgi:hypothetical protein
MGETAKLTPAMTPEAGAAAIFRTCAAQREAALAAGEASAAALPEDARAGELANIRARFGEKFIASTIRLDRAEEATNQCIAGHAQKLAATDTPEAAAPTIFRACAALRDASVKARVGWLEAIPTRDEWYEALVTHFKTQMNSKDEIATAEKEIADTIRKQRAAAPAPAQ